MAKKDTEVAEDQAPKGGKKKKIILILVAVLLLLGGTFAYLWFFTPIIGPNPNATPTPEASATAEPPLAEKTVNIDSITVNLAGNSGFLKVKLSVQFGAETDQSTLSTAAINDEIIKLYSQLSVQELADPAVKEVAKGHLRERLNELYGKDAVSAIYYTEFVTQST